jgi:hypothetical protein
MITILFYVINMGNVNTFAFWRAISKSRRSANRVLSSQLRIYRLAFKSEDSQDALVNTAQWFTRDEPLQGFNTQREFPRGK